MSIAQRITNDPKQARESERNIADSPTYRCYLRATSLESLPIAEYERTFVVLVYRESK